MIVKNMAPPPTESISFLPSILGAILVLVEGCGIISALHALMRVRTSQGTIAWCIALVTFPWVALPLYWIFGSNKFHDYVNTLRAAIEEHKGLVDEVTEVMKPHHGAFDRKNHPCEYALDILTARKFTKGNRVDLLIDGEATFGAIFDAIDRATDYILVQFFIIKDDATGNRLKKKLISRRIDGIRVYLLYDEIGSHRLGSAYIADLSAAGVDVRGFGTRRGRTNPLQVNFRNHRKIVIADGRVAFVGGHNVGDEYLGKSPRFGHWRDTHVRVEGPAVQSIQAIFLGDWYWAARKVPDDWEWRPRPVDGHNTCILPLETGPTHHIEACTLMFHHLIGSARERLWIASPYFVPDEGVANALQLAALRGVDVRILIPAKPDHRTVYLAAFSYFEAMDAAGVKMFRYENGFLHQKVALVDDSLAVVGTANLDNRSFRLNFELNIVVSNREFAKEVEKMLEDDLARCRRVDGRDYTERSIDFRYAVRVARLFAPIL